MKKRMAVVSFDVQAGEYYVELMNDLFGEYVDAVRYSTGDGTIADIPPADLFVVSNDAFESREAFRRHVPEEVDCVEVGVIFPKESLSRLTALPAGQKAFFVNLSDKMVRESITQLSQLGINHLDFIPCYPGATPEGGWPKDVTLAITPCESRFAPAHVTEIIDLGQRIFDSITIVEIAVKLKLDFLLGTPVFREYFKRTATHRYSIDELYGRSLRLESRFEILMELFDWGIVGVNEDNRIFACNSKAVEIAGVNRNLVLDAIVDDVLPGVPFAACRKNMERIDSCMVKLQGCDVHATIVPVLRGSVYTGAVAMLQRFDEEESKQQRLRVQLLGKGHQARYSFKDILGESPEIRKAVTLASRIAPGESSILITGESGTGKELFAHAIHQASRRGQHPFVALNCAALPDALLESELFGYEDGAFTGARKGGRQGLFEFAHLGTLFLDEIEGMSPALQVRLLRVLQEKEVMRVGGQQLIRVDVRIIAASNKELEQMVTDGSFRRDLYFRLCVLPVRLPPLRERGLDIMILFEQFQKEMGTAFFLSPETEEAFLSHTWPGNIRELRNCAEWCTHLQKSPITPEDLPQGFFGRLKSAERVTETDLQEMEMFKKLTGRLYPEYRFILLALSDCSEQGRAGSASLGRDSLLRLAEESQMPLSQREIRTILAHLDTMGLIKVYKGRGGSRITPGGLKLAGHIRGGAATTISL